MRLINEQFLYYFVVLDELGFSVLCLFLSKLAILRVVLSESSPNLQRQASI